MTTSSALLVCVIPNHYSICMALAPYNWAITADRKSLDSNVELDQNKSPC